MGEVQVGADGEGLAFCSRCSAGISKVYGTELILTVHKFARCLGQLLTLG